MKEIKYRQPIFCEGKFSYWHYWGDVKGGFLSPINANLKRDSQECTGLKDKNGKEIFRGDFIRLNNDDHLIGEVIFEKGCFCLKEENSITEFSHYKESQFEVIGNTTENPELITQLHDTIATVEKKIFTQGKLDL